MKKLIVFLVVVILLTIPSGIVLGQDTCPTDNGWSCFKLEGIDTVGLYFIVEQEYPVQKVWINGTLFEKDTKKDECFFISGLGTVRVEILSNCGTIVEIGEYFIAPATVTPTNTATPIATATYVATATPIATAIYVATTTSTVPTTETIPATNPIVLLIVGLSFLALAAIIIIALIVRKNAKH